ncbi:MAG: hypothetical protein JWM58_926 [Rhizobium sp.]|nr:hypothetical protein [Rhizobium sp.]
MPSSNIEIVQNIYDAFLRGDIPTVVEGLSPDATWALVGREQDVPFAGIRNGKTGATDFFRILAETVDVGSFVPREYLAAEDKVFVWGDWQWTVRRNGVGGKAEWLHVFVMKNGKVTSWRSHTDTAQIAATLHAPASGTDRRAAGR